MESFVLGRLGLPHFPQDFHPSIGKAAQGHRFALPLISMGLSVGRSPRGFGSAQVSPPMDGVGQVLVAMPPNVDLVDLAALKTHRCGARIALQTSGFIEAPPVVPQLTEQARPELATYAGQGSKHIVIGVIGKKLLNGCAILVRLFLQGAQRLDQRKGKPTLGSCDGLRSAQLRRSGKDRHAPLHVLRTLPKLVGMEELFPFPFAR